MADNPALEAEQERIRELHYAEDWGMAFEFLNLPRMAGRVWATLAIASEPYLAADDLEDRLEASAGSVNTALRFLLLKQTGIVQVPDPPVHRRPAALFSSSCFPCCEGLFHAKPLPQPPIEPAHRVGQPSAEQSPEGLQQQMPGQLVIVGPGYQSAFSVHLPLLLM